MSPFQIRSALTHDPVNNDAAIDGAVRDLITWQGAPLRYGENDAVDDHGYSEETAGAVKKDGNRIYTEGLTIYKVGQYVGRSSLFPIRQESDMFAARSLVALLAVLLLSGCYRATVHTGLAPSTQRVERAWAHGFLYGLVPPSDLDAGALCPNGVARVDTELSFLNQLAAGLTLGLYTPMTIRATCAN